MGGRWWRKLAQAGAALLTGLSWIGLAGAEVVTANDAVLEAARRNPAIEAAVHDVAAARHGFDAADRERTPRYFASAQGEYAEAHTGAASGVALTDRRSISGATGVRYTTPVGTDLEIGVEAGASWRSSTITAATTDKVTIGPNYSGRLYATIRQPLLQGAGTDAVLAPVVQAETARTIAERQRDQAASQVIADVLSAYWELWYAQHAVEVQRAALAVAERQHAETELKIETLGTAARVELLQYATSRATIQEALNTALRTRATRAVELGRLMGLAPPEARRLVAAAEPPEAVALPPTELRYRAAHEQARGMRSL